MSEFSKDNNLESSYSIYKTLNYIMKSMID